MASDAPVHIANPIYQEIIPRSLSYIAQEYLDQRAAWYLRDGGGLDMVLLLREAATPEGQRVYVFGA